MPITPLFPLPEGLEITSISDTPEELLICVTSHRPSSLCPLCLTPSSAIHSDYCRHPRVRLSVIDTPGGVGSSKRLRLKRQSQDWESQKRRVRRGGARHQR